MAGVSCQKGQAEEDFIPVTVFDPNRDASKDIELAKQESQRTGKLILLNVGGDWCTWCQKFDQFFENNTDITDYLHQNFVLIKVNFSPDNRNKNVLSKFPAISGYPHLFVLDSSGQLVISQDTAAMEKGSSYDLDKVLGFLKKYAPVSTVSL